MSAREIGQIEAIFRYPVKSMRGEPLDAGTLGWHGLEGDRRLAFRRLDERGGFPWLTGTKLPALILFTPQRHDGANGEDLPTHVLTPEGEALPLFAEVLAADVGRRCKASVQMMELRHGIFDDATISVITSVGRYFRAPGHPDGEVALVKPDGTGYLTLDADGANNGFPSWSPDGKRLVYKKDHHLVIRNVADSSLAILTPPGPQFDNFPQWSPKGDWIVFTSDRERSADFKLYLIRPDGSGLRKLTDSPGDAHPIWSPDGQWIMFSSGRMGFKDERVLSEAIPQPYGELFIVHPDGTGLRQLTDNQWEDATPAWMPLRSAAGSVHR